MISESVSLGLQTGESWPAKLKIEKGFHLSSGVQRNRPVIRPNMRTLKHLCNVPNPSAP